MLVPPSQMSARLFVAVPIHNQVRQIMEHWTEQLKDRFLFGKWVHPSDYHITLKYLGETNFERTQELKSVLKQVANQTSPFPVSMYRLGTFGSPVSPRIFCISVGGDVDSLKSLQAKVNEQMIVIGYDEEKRTYHPHVTLAKKYRGETPWQEELLKSYPQPKEEDLMWTAKEMVLYQSHIHRKPMYQPLAVFPFNNGKV